MGQTTIRRAGKQWRDGAPDYVVDCFDAGDKFVDRYTVFVNVISHGEVMYLATNETGTFSGWQSTPLHMARAYRYRHGHRRISWADLPDKVKDMVRDIERDN